MTKQIVTHYIRGIMPKKYNKPPSLYQTLINTSF